MCVCEREREKDCVCIEMLLSYLAGCHMIGASRFTKDLFVDGNAILFKKNDYIISDFKFGLNTPLLE
jgi:hypothetical protein